MNLHFPTIACPIPLGANYQTDAIDPQCHVHVDQKELATRKFKIKAFNNHFGLAFPHKPAPNGLLLQLYSLHHSDETVRLQTAH